MAASTVDGGVVAKASNEASNIRAVAWEWPDRRRLVIGYGAVFFWFLPWFIIINVNPSKCSFSVFFKEHKWAMNTYPLVMLLVVIKIAYIAHGETKEIQIGGKLQKLLEWAFAMICLLCCETSSDWWSAAIGLSMAFFALFSCLLLGVADNFNFYETFIGMTIQAAVTEMKKKKKMEGWEYLIIGFYTFFMLFAKYFANWGCGRVFGVAADGIPV